MSAPDDAASTRLPRARSRRRRWKCDAGWMGVGIAVLSAMMGGAVAQEIVQIEVTTTVPGPMGPAVTVRSTIITRAFTTITRFTTTTPPIVVSTVIPTPISWTWTTDPEAQPPLPTPKPNVDPAQGTTPYCTDEGYAACPGSLGGGCCPYNYLCAVSSCIPPSPLPTIATRICSPQSRLCPATMGFGCCPESMDCAIGSCVPFATSPATETAISKAGDLPTLVPLPPIDPVKRPAITPPGGKKKLPNLAIGGIAAACAVVLIAAGIGAWFTYRRVQRRNGGQSGSGNNTPEPGEGVPTANAYDPLAPAPALRRGSWRASLSSPNLSTPIQPWLRGGDLGSSSNDTVDLVSTGRRDSGSGGWMASVGSANSRISAISAANSRVSLTSQRRGSGPMSPLSPKFPSPEMVEVATGGGGSGPGSPVMTGAAGLGRQQWHRSTSSLDHGARMQAHQAVEMATRSSIRSRSGSGGQWGVTAHF